MNTITPKQETFIHKLIEERNGAAGLESIRLGLNADYSAGKLSKRAASEYIDRLLAIKPTTPRLPSPRPGVEVPAGHYAVKSATGNNDLDFYRIDRPTEGKWAGRTFVKRVIGGRPDVAVRNAGERQQVLDRIFEAGVEESGKLYAKEIGRCRRCNRHLTDEDSRVGRNGYGATCYAIAAGG